MGEGNRCDSCGAPFNAIILFPFEVVPPVSKEAFILMLVSSDSMTNRLGRPEKPPCPERQSSPNG